MDACACACVSAGSGGELCGPRAQCARAWMPTHAQRPMHHAQRNGAATATGRIKPNDGSLTMSLRKYSCRSLTATGVPHHVASNTSPYPPRPTRPPSVISSQGMMKLDGTCIATLSWGGLRHCQLDAWGLQRRACLSVCVCVPVRAPVCVRARVDEWPHGRAVRIEAGAAATHSSSCLLYSLASTSSSCTNIVRSDRSRTL